MSGTGVQIYDVFMSNWRGDGTRLTPHEIFRSVGAHPTNSK